MRILSLTLISFVAPLFGALVFGIALLPAFFLIAGCIYGILSYIKYIDSIAANDSLTDEQKATIVNAVSLITAFASIIGYMKAGGEISAAAMGCLEPIPVGQ